MLIGRLPGGERFAYSQVTSSLLWEGAQAPVGQVLVVRSGREADPPLSLCELCGLAAPDPRALERGWETLQVETPESSQNGLLFKDERATKAVLSFLRKTRVGQMITVPPRDAGGEEEARQRQRWKGRRGGQGPPLEIEKREGPEEGAAFRERGGVGFWAWDWGGAAEIGRAHV